MRDLSNQQLVELRAFGYLDAPEARSAGGDYAMRRSDGTLIYEPDFPAEIQKLRNLDEITVCMMCRTGRCDECYNYWNKRAGKFVCDCAEASHHGKAPVPVRASCSTCAKPLSKPGQFHYGCDGTASFGQVVCACDQHNRCAARTEIRNKQKLCESCDGRGYSWVEDKRLPALFCLSCAPCSACQAEDHTKWQGVWKKITEQERQVHVLQQTTQDNGGRNAR